MTEFALDFTVAFIFVICNVALATFVAVRAWDHRPARVFVLLIALLVGMGIAIFGQAIFRTPEALYLLRSVFLNTIGLLTAVFVALLSAMFTPEWWRGRRPIIWILLPYLIISTILGIDLLARLGIFVDGMTITDNSANFSITWLGKLLMILLSLSWIVPFSMMITAFVRDRQTRLPIMMLGGGVIVTLFLNIIRGILPESAVLRGMLFLTPLPITLALAVFRTRLITPLRAAIDQAFEAMSDVAIVLNNTEQITYANARATDLGFRANTTLAEVNANLDTTITKHRGGPPQRLMVNGRQLMVSMRILTDKYGQQLGALVLGRDVTEIEERTIQLEQERAHLSRLVSALEAEQRERAALFATVQALALPMIPILDGVLVLPLVGAFDTARMGDLRMQMLEAIERERARVVILDLTGLSFLDAQGVAGLTGSVQAARLLGTQCVLVGVRPEIAETIVAQGLVVDNIPTAATLQEAVRQALMRTKMAGAQ